MCQLNSNLQSGCNNNLHKKKSNGHETPIVISDNEKCLENHVLKLLNSANVPAKSTESIHVIPKRISEATNCIKNQHTVKITMPQNFSLKVSKFQKQIFLFSFEPKNEKKIFFVFCPSL